MARKPPPSSIVDHTAMVECGTSHQRFARCADGVSRVPGNRRKRSTENANAAAVPAPQAAAAPSREELAKVELITDPAQIAMLAPDDLKRQLLLRAEMDKAAAEHAKAEAESGVHLNRPEILRRPNEKAAEILLRQLDHTLATADATRIVAADPSAANLKKYVPVEEVEQTREILAGIPEMRDKKAAEEREREARKTHVNGDTIWLCENPGAKCNGHSFRGASLEIIRRKAKAEPGWQWVCPSCKGGRVRLADLQEVA